MNEVSQPNRQTAQRSGPAISPGLLRVSVVGAGMLLLLAALAWLTSLEQSLPDIRTPRDVTSSSVLPEHTVMMPGTMDIESIDADLAGDWVTQEIGDSDWLATDVEGSRMRAAFYGTDVYVLARMGPDASRAYISVDQQPVDHLASDELGSYVNLWAGETSDQPVLIARNLAHGEHLVEIVAEGDGELAISGFEVVSSTPFPWAFALGYLGLAGGLFLGFRSFFYTINRRSGEVMSSISRPPFGADR